MVRFHSSPLQALSEDGAFFMLYFYWRRLYAFLGILKKYYHCFLFHIYFWLFRVSLKVIVKIGLLNRI